MRRPVRTPRSPIRAFDGNKKDWRRPVTRQKHKRFYLTPWTVRMPGNRFAEFNGLNEA